MPDRSWTVRPVKDSGYVVTYKKTAGWLILGSHVFCMTPDAKRYTPQASYFPGSPLAKVAVASS